MDSRSKKSRSLAIDEKSSSTKDRHNSVPAVKPRRESQSKRVSTGTKASETSKRSSKTSQKDDAKPRTSSTRLSEPPRSENLSRLPQVGR